MPDAYSALAEIYVRPTETQKLTPAQAAGQEDDDAVGTEGIQGGRMAANS